MIRALSRWFLASRRDLPWRTPPGEPRDPYLVLVSETMLQQTQVSRVIEKFTRFAARFPTVQSLAAAPIDDVLALWSGLGYYRRARNLHAAAQQIVSRFNAVVPRSVDDLLTLPGVGRYTAGAIASIAHATPALAVDGNIQRVLMRLEGIDMPPDDRAAQARVWHTADALVRSVPDPGVWTEALMELGATVCIPKSPRCGECPIADHCAARARGEQYRIPAPKSRRAPSEVFHAVALVRDTKGRVLLEQRGASGMWAGLWQPPTIETDAAWPSAAELKSALGLRAARALEDFVFQTTHRTVRVRVFAGAADKPRRGEFVAPARFDSLGLSSLASRILSIDPAPRAPKRPLTPR